MIHERKCCGTFEGSPHRTGCNAATLSPVMLEAIAYAQEHGALCRCPGGFWKKEGGGGIHFGTSTIEALVKRGVAAYTEWKTGRTGQFPIRCELVEREGSAGCQGKST